MSAKARKSEEAAAPFGEWLRALGKLIDEAEGWTKNQGWTVAREAVVVSEPQQAPYRADVLRIKMPKGEVRLEPIGWKFIGADGRVDLLAWSSLNRVKLVMRGGEWQVFTDSNIRLKDKPWGEETFRDLVTDLDESA
ncbi:MAG: hypothetical protein K2Q09_07500 [Phycisphaerales bacterium]|nr:hypothetical protein [Phycisphaerales bacterium]